MATKDNSKQRLIAIAAVVIVILLGVNAFLLVNKAKQDSKNRELTGQLDEAEQLKAELEQEYYTALSELENMRGNNEELNEIIEQQKADLEEQRNKIARLIRTSNDLEEARAELRKLNAKIEQYIAENTKLKEENELLTAQKEQLAMQNDSLSTNLQATHDQNQELSTARAALMSENEALSTEKAVLSKKVSIASVVKVEGIEAIGYKIKNNGKEASRDKAKNVDFLRVCFQTTNNQVTEPGTEEFFVRVINPVGETMAIEGLGSGAFTSNASGDEIRFTKTVDTEYNRDEQNLCMDWKPNAPFQEGLYEVEIYNKGYLAGTGTFELK